MSNVIGVNWNLIYRKQVEKLNKTIDRLKREKYCYENKIS
jgi:hypothetical protein